MQRGKVKWFNETKGYGYIVDESGQEIFVHFTAIQMPGYRTLTPGELVQFDFVLGEKGPLATRVVPFSIVGEHAGH